MRGTRALFTETASFVHSALTSLAQFCLSEKGAHGHHGSTHGHQSMSADEVNGLQEQLARLLMDKAEMERLLRHWKALHENEVR